MTTPRKAPDPLNVRVHLKEVQCFLETIVSFGPISFAESARTLLETNRKILRKDQIQKENSKNRKDIYIPVEEKKTNQWRSKDAV